jgi:hypothetical protein
MNMKDKESLILNYLGDKILTYRWREYEKIHSLIMRSELNKDEYLDMCDKLRDLEKEIEATLSGRALAIKRKEMYKDIIDRDKRTLERTG